MISDFLTPLLEKRFPNQGIKASSGKDPLMVFPAKHPNFGDIEIHDDGDEITLVAGKFTHGHFSMNDEEPKENEERRVAEEVIEFLELTFADKVEFWGRHIGVGGWKVLGINPPKKGKIFKVFTWSGPVEKNS